MAARALILVEGDTLGTGLLYVQAARRLRLHPIVLSADPSRHGYLAAEGIEVIHADTSDLDALIAECCRLSARYNIAGITSSEEPFYATIGKLCRHFALPGPNPTSVERCCNKFTQRQLLSQAGLPIPAYRLATNVAGAISSAAEIGLPVVLKPAVGTGSVGVRLCCNNDELSDHATHLLGGARMHPPGTSSPNLLVEELVQGPQYIVHMMADEVIGIEAAEFRPPPHFVYHEFTFPALMTDGEHEHISDVSLNCLRALGLGWGPTNIEFRWSTLGPVIIEVNPRIAGAPEPQLVQLACGVDLIMEHIKLVIGDEWDLRKTRSHSAGVRFLTSDGDGVLDWIHGASRAAALSGVAEVKLYVEPKTPIVRTGDYRDVMGHVVAASPSHARTQMILRRAAEAIGWSMTPFPGLDEPDERAGPCLAARAQATPSNT